MFKLKDWIFHPFSTYKKCRIKRKIDLCLAHKLDEIKTPEEQEKEFQQFKRDLGYGGEVRYYPVDKLPKDSLELRR